MIERSVLSAGLILLFMFSGCASNREAVDTSVTDKVPQVMPSRISPNHARIVGKIIRIHPELSENKDHPSSQAPSLADVRIEKLLGTGMAFPGSISEGKTVTVKFAFTLSPTKDLFPELKDHLPGLKINDRFQADMMGTDSRSGGVAYTIDGYTKK
ncbi:MAG: hypothetical protein GY863_05345 [bacterium]|nr:hypothetical protein [bacterium]